MKKTTSIPPNYFYACLILCVILRIVLPDFKFILFPYNLTGLLFIAYGIYLVINPWYLFKKHNTPESFDESTSLVKEGIYKYSRNPMYLGGIFILAGLSLILNNWISFICTLIFFLFMHFMFIPFEEERLYKTFGDDYLEYKKKVRKWI